jgi:hypothetical protein
VGFGGFKRGAGDDEALPVVMINRSKCKIENDAKLMYLKW